MNDPTGSHSKEGSNTQELAELRAALVEACRGREEWPDKVAAGIYAALDFAVADPQRALDLLARDGEGDSEASAYGQAVDCVNRLLDRIVPAAALAGGSTGPVQGIAMIVSDHLRAERDDGLARIGPELVEFTLQPYLGYAEAKRWADRSDER
jgi:hypothetical protein